MPKFATSIGSDSGGSGGGATSASVAADRSLYREEVAPRTTKNASEVNNIYEDLLEEEEEEGEANSL